MNISSIAFRMTLLGVLASTVACQSKYEKGLAAGNAEGYKEGYDVGYEDGDKDGHARGYSDGEIYFGAATYDNGVSDGIKVGTPIGYAQGYTVGKNETYGPAYNQGKVDGYNPGYNAGKTAGYNQGYNDGDEDGYDDGFADGRSTIQGAINWNYNIGHSNGYDDGYDDGWVKGDAHGYSDGYSDGYDDGLDAHYASGFDDGYDVGFDDGWDAALSVRPTGSLKGTSNILSMFHNDLFNYKKIAAPKSTAKGLVAGNKLIFEETSLSNKDLEGRAAAAERYLVSSMASQVKTQFSLSAERSTQIAKVANHFRKASTNRAITEADSNTYAKEILGVNFKQLEVAYKGVLKGEKAELSSVLDQAAQKNGTSPEHMSSLMLKLFF